VTAETWAQQVWGIEGLGGSLGHIKAIYADRIRADIAAIIVDVQKAARDERDREWIKAVQAAIGGEPIGHPTPTDFAPAMQATWDRARALEREACAKIADDAAEANASDYSPEGPVCAYTAECIAEEIRARSEPQKAEEENR